MKASEKIPEVAILINTSGSWGRFIVKGILSYANEVGPWHIWVKPNSPDRFDGLPKGWRGDGVIARVNTDSLAEELRETELPVVNVDDGSYKGFSAPCIRTDDKASTKIAANHFIERGIRQFAFVGPSYIANAQWYGKAFRDHLYNQSLECEEFWIQQDDSNIEEQLEPWLKKLPKPCGLLAWGHGFARNVVDTCMQAGISVPHDIAILGGSYDDLFSHACFPSLSGLIAPTEQIGYQAAQTLHQMMQGEKVAHTTTYIPPRGIMERLSTDTMAVQDDKLVQVVSFLREHALEPITMTDILKEVPMARRSLERRFKQAFGRSPTDEIRRIRIDRARKLLTETDLPMQEIAESCGYATYNYLTHVFKQTTGMTPRDYRKQFKA